MADSCQEEYSLPAQLIQRFYFVYVPWHLQGGTVVATAHQTDIRGLGTARLVFVAELPLSSIVSSAKGLIQ